MSDAPPEDTFKILLATDIHLGYGETNPVREKDTYNTFEEILQIANTEKVDFILLGGDLFHDTRPSTYCTRKCIELIKKYCMGDTPVEIEFLSDPSLHFENPTVNYEDPNVNISIPVFSIHGNHDDPTGKTQTSAMEVLSIYNLVNYFGRQNDVTNVIVNPILLRKGSTHLALYGLSHVRDERLSRLFLNQKVTMRTPEKVSDWFNIFVLHQNRANRGVKNYIPETVIPEFFDLVMWGHEHDCRIDPVAMADGCAYITQPGSSVATSLSEGESIPKKVGILRVHGKNFNITPKELQTVRPFIFKTIQLDPPDMKTVGQTTPVDKAKAFITKEIENMIKKAKELGRQEHLLPLIRLIVKYEDERQVFNSIMFGQNFAERVANPQDIIKFNSVIKKVKRTRALADGSSDDADFDDEEINRVEDLIPKYCNKLEVLSLAGLNEAVKKYIDANDLEAPAFLINNQEEYTLNKLLELQPDEDDIDKCIEQLRSARTADEFRQLLEDPNRPKNATPVSDDSGDSNLIVIDDNSDKDSDTSMSFAKPAKGPGSRGGRGSRGGKGSRGPRGGRGRAK